MRELAFKDTNESIGADGVVIYLLVVKCDSKPFLIPVTWQIKYLPFSSFKIFESKVIDDPLPICLPFTGTDG